MNFMNEQLTGFFQNFQPANPQLAGSMKNIFSGNPQLVEGFRTNIETQLAQLKALSAKAFESVDKIVELNLSAARAAVEENAVIAKQLLASTGPQEFFSLLAALPEPTVAKAAAYSRHLAGIATGVQEEITRVTQERLAERSTKLVSLVEDIAKEVPAVAQEASANLVTAEEVQPEVVALGKDVQESVESEAGNAIARISHATETASGNTGRSRKHS